ncbi:hypothetical protein [Halostreptopolyspora alba]|uniref:CDP-alcohol phosphatidyltransferase family protein n=1 Tax=Halostreptopolyspora alba TaxID=2487137 RepID=A0A3N0E3D1_9ACTN|nr:hypothetical protein EFW17_19670 [Nocardiopsaceae bacterium YIM 96095]
MAKVREYAVRVANAVLRPVSRSAARWAARASLSRAGLARIGLVLAVLAAVWFTEGGLRGALVGSLLLGAVLFTDTVAADLEGERGDALAGWLALLLSRLREYVVYAGLAIGGVVTGVPDAWTWAAGALVTLALYESVATARLASGARDTGAPSAPPVPRPHDSPIAAMDPSRPKGGPEPSDPALTAKLLGDAPQQPVGETEPTGPIRIRTTPKSTVDAAKWQEGRRRALRGLGLTESTPEGGAYPAVRGPARLWRPWAPRIPRLPRVRVPYSQAARFAVIALTITIWDTRVTFVALITGGLIALCGALAPPSARDTVR